MGDRNTAEIEQKYKYYTIYPTESFPATLSDVIKAIIYSNLKPLHGHYLEKYDMYCLWNQL